MSIERRVAKRYMERMATRVLERWESADGSEYIQVVEVKPLKTYRVEGTPPTSRGEHPMNVWGQKFQHAWPTEDAGAGYTVQPWRDQGGVRLQTVTLVERGGVDLGTYVSAITSGVAKAAKGAGWRKTKAAKVKVAGRVRYYANPYDRSAKGFYFTDAKDFDKKWKAARKAGGPEEYEIDFIDGPRELGQLFEAAHVGQSELDEWEKLVDEPDQWPAAYYLLAHHGERDIKKVLQRVEDVRVTEGTAKDYAEELVDSMGGPMELGKETLEMYFDMDAYARDMELNGDVREFRFGGKEFTAETQF